ncbi:S8 family peptidase [Ruminiclostridium josui]|uniref:S8 family peptidase n=1 Tax=Ruminiclostridium josui TaxID=1499 RepID=UPI000467E526|nr:S8 family serine peptidase [Ruminiclostridium josui]
MNTVPINIAIIDDGVNEKYYQMGRLSYNLEITRDLAVCDRLDYDPHSPSHGTTCAAIIKKYSPEADIGSVKILDSNSRTGVKTQLIHGLKWCADNNIRIVNLSLGTIDYRDFSEVKEALDYALEKNVIVVAACNNRNIFTCPASFEKVIGVKCDLDGLLEEGQYIFNKDPMDGIDICACAKHSLKKYDGTGKVTNECNSYAAPMITAHVHNLLRNSPNMGVDEIKAVLRQEAYKENAEYSHSWEKRKDIDIPIILFNNNSLHDFEKGLTQKFRRDGYNALCVFVNKIEPDISNGYIYAGDFLKEKYTLNNCFYNISDIFDPDILLLSYDNQKSDNIPMSDITAVDYDIEICAKSTYELEVKSSYGIRFFRDFNYNQLEKLYSYILELFEKEEN